MAGARQGSRQIDYVRAGQKRVLALLLRSERTQCSVEWTLCQHHLSGGQRPLRCVSLARGTSTRLSHRRFAGAAFCVQNCGDYRSLCLSVLLPLFWPSRGSYSFFFLPRARQTSKGRLQHSVTPAKATKIVAALTNSFEPESYGVIPREVFTGETRITRSRFALSGSFYGVYSTCRL